MSLARPAFAAAALVAVVTAAALVSPEPSAREIVNRARRVHGVAELDEACVAFSFRGTAYVAARQGRRFAYRMYPAVDLGFSTDQGGPVPLDTIGDAPFRELARLTNDGLVVDTFAFEAYRRILRGDPLNAPPSLSYITFHDFDAEIAPLRDSVRANAAAIVRAAETQLNSVVYFALLPYNLNDPAVRLKRLDDAGFDGRMHHTVEVTFNQDGGGRDHDDRFVYWFEANSGRLRALAYRFHTGDGGTRFRRVSRIHEVKNGDTHALLWLNDYEAYTDTTLGDRIETYPQRLGAATMQRLPDIAFDRDLFSEGHPFILAVTNTHQTTRQFPPEYWQAQGACEVD